MTKVLLIDLGRGCNRQCGYCLNDPNERFETETEKAKQIIKEGKSMGCDAISFTGGEPLMRKDIFELAKYAGDLGLREIKLQTNGDFINEDNIRKMEGAGISNLLVSHHKSNSEKVRNSMKNLLQKKFRIEICYVVTKKTYREMIPFLESYMGFREKIRFYFVFMMTRDHVISDHPELMLSLTEFKPELERLCEFCREHGYSFAVEGVPQCVFGKDYVHSAEHAREKNKIEIFRYSGGKLHKNIELGGSGSLEEKERFDYCYSCGFFNDCFGPWKNYPGIFRDEKMLGKNNPQVRENNRRLAEKMPVPEEAKIEITGECNNSCPYCFNRLTLNSPGYPRKEPMKKEELSRLFRQLKDAGVKSVRLTGGEPFTRKDFGGILQELKKQGFYTRVNTNLLLYEQNMDLMEFVDDMLVSFNELPFLPDFNKEHYETKKRNLEDARKKVRILSISIIIDNAMLEKFNEMAEFCEGLDVDNVVFLYPFSPHKPVDYDELTYFLYMLKKLKEKSSKNYVIGNPLPMCRFKKDIISSLVSHNFLFEYGICSFVIDPCGNLRMNYVNPITFGNALEEDVSVLLKRMNEKVNYWESLQENCRNCINLASCGGALKDSSEFSTSPFYDFGDRKC